MTSEAIRDPLADHLITPQNSALVLIDYQPEQIATVRSMDHDLLVKNAVSTRPGGEGVRSPDRPLDRQRRIRPGQADHRRARRAARG